MTVLTSAQRRSLGGPYCRAMTDPQPGCARGDCCRRHSGDGTEGLGAIADRVVSEMLRHHEAPRPGRHGLSVEASVQLVLALDRALLDATLGTEYAGSLRVEDHPDAARERNGVARYRVVERPLRTTVLNVVMGGGLCVGSSGRGTWIVHSPPVRAVVVP